VTFLQLCQAIARDSGTIPNLPAPSTTASQTGRLLRVVNWTSEAYGDIQRKRKDWLWLRNEFSGNTIAATQRYAAAAMGITDRFGHWVFESDTGEWGKESMSCYLTATGRSDETRLHFKPWREFRDIYLFGNNADDTGKPTYFTVDPQQKIVLWPIPDADYTVRGEYFKSPQILAVDGDIPEMPVAYHEAIKWQGLLLLGTFDEAAEQMQVWQAFLAAHYKGLIRDHTPRLEFSGPLA